MGLSLRPSLKSRTKVIFCSFHTRSKACVFVCPRFSSPICHFDCTVKPVHQFSRRVNSPLSIFLLLQVFLVRDLPLLARLTLVLAVFSLLCDLSSLAPVFVFLSLSLTFSELFSVCSLTSSTHSELNFLQDIERYYFHMRKIVHRPDHVQVWKFPIQENSCFKSS